MAKANMDFVKKVIVPLVLIFVVLSASILVSLFFLLQSYGQDSKDDCRVGVAFCGNTTLEAKLLIDKVKNFTNLFVLQSGPVSKNETATNEICDYATDAGLKIIVYFGDLDPRVLSNETDWRIDWISSAKGRWGDRLLGIYYYDEPGGIYIDCDWKEALQPFDHNGTYDSFVAERDYNSASSFFVDAIRGDPGCNLIRESNLNLFVSDYALYWFDYLAGYDVVLAQAGWNHSLAQDIALLRGAADAQGKDWGVMITWKYTEEPYLASAEETYGQMVDSYKAGAKYIVIFNYPQLISGGLGVMTDAHFESLERFWKTVIENPKSQLRYAKAEAALILPNNYAWGMRHPQDRIWGHWGPDEKSNAIWNISRALLAEYDLRFDIIYEDHSFPIGNKYEKTYFWNQTT